MEFITELFTMARKWKIKLCGFETVLFQRVLAFFFKKEMKEQRFWLTLNEVEDRRNKKVRIVQDISGPANAGDVFIKAEHHEFIAQFIEFPDVNHDDILDAFSIAIQTLTKYNILDDYIEGEFEEVDDPEQGQFIEDWSRGAP